MNEIKNRLKEPSTYAGLATVAQGISLIAGGVTSGPAFAMVFGGLAAILLPESNKQQSTNSPDENHNDS